MKILVFFNLGLILIIVAILTVGHNLALTTSFVEILETQTLAKHCISVQTGMPPKASQINFNFT